MDIYNRIVNLPKGRAREINKLLMCVPHNSPLHKIPQEQLSDGLSKAHFHGNGTNNMAEVVNKMLGPARESDTLFDALLRTVQMLHRRHEQLSDNLSSRKQELAGTHASVTKHSPFPTGSCVKAVETERYVQLQMTLKLLPPQPTVANLEVCSRDKPFCHIVHACICMIFLLGSHCQLISLTEDVPLTWVSFLHTCRSFKIRRATLPSMLTSPSSQRDHMKRLAHVVE